MDEKADFTSIVPTQLHKALTEDEKLLKHLQGCKAVLVGGARLPDNLRQQAENSGIKIVTTYGATETCGGCVYDGTPLDGVKIQINNGLIEIQISNLNSGDWIKTNDFGEFINGKLVVNGRADDVIISGGENISLSRLEKFLENKYAPQIFLAVGIEDVKWGESIGLLSNKEFPYNLNDVITSELGKLYLPKVSKVVSEIPTMGIGKYDRAAAARLF
jgi:O-succinylbenzoic acid--CoA ligase